MPITVAPEKPCAPAVVVPAPKVCTRRIVLVLFLLLNFIYLLTSTGRVRSMDEVDPVMQSESLLLRHNTALPQALSSGVYLGKLDRHGVPRSAWPAGHAILVLPWSVLGHYGLARLPGMPPAIGDLASETAICWSNASYAAWAVAAAFLLFLRMGIGRPAALACSMMLAFATPLFVYSGWLYSEPATTAILITIALLLFDGGKPSAGGIAAGALLLGFILHVRPANVVMAAVVIIAAAAMEHGQARRGFRYPVTAVLTAVVFLSGMLYLLRNQVFFGNPFDFGLPANVEGGKDLASWRTPLAVGLFGFLFSPGKSIFLFCPPVVLGVAGLPRLWRNNRGLAVLCGGAPLANLFFYSVYTQWEGGYCWGPRYMVPSVLLLTLSAGALFLDSPRWLRPAFWISTAAGFVLQAIGLSTNVLEDMVANHYYIGNWNYRMSYSPITGQLRLIWKYLQVSSPELGLGWDRWFVFLRAAGANPQLLAANAALFLLGAVICGALLWRWTHMPRFAASERSK